MIRASQFTGAYLPLLAEIFGVSPAPHGYILDTGSSGLLGTIDALSAEVASRTPSPDQPSIAAHCGHLLFLLNFFNAFERGETPQPDWPGSWKTQTVDDAEWETLRRDLRIAYETATENVRTHEETHQEWSQMAIGGAIMLIAHSAYHVGEIRQRLLWVAPERNAA